jgi:hypothetical protein
MSTVRVHTGSHLVNYVIQQLPSDYHPKTRSENCPSILFDGVPGVPTAGNTAGCGPGVLAGVPGVCPGFRNADADGASRIGVPTVGVL